MHARFLSADNSFFNYHVNTEQELQAFCDGVVETLYSMKGHSRPSGGHQVPSAPRLALPVQPTVPTARRSVALMYQFLDGIKALLDGSGALWSLFPAPLSQDKDLQKAAVRGLMDRIATFYNTRDVMHGHIIQMHSLAVAMGVALACSASSLQNLLSGRTGEQQLRELEELWKTEHYSRNLQLTLCDVNQEALIPFIHLQPPVDVTQLPQLDVPFMLKVVADLHNALHATTLSPPSLNAVTYALATAVHTSVTADLKPSVIPAFVPKDKKTLVPKGTEAKQSETKQSETKERSFSEQATQESDSSKKRKKAPYAKKDSSADPSAMLPISDWTEGYLQGFKKDVCRVRLTNCFTSRLR